MTKMNREWDEAESFHNTVKQKNMNARNRIAKGNESAMTFTSIQEPEGGMAAIDDAHQESLEDLHGENHCVILVHSKPTRNIIIAIHSFNLMRVCLVLIRVLCWNNI